MARSKNATALFEVIHTAKRPPKASPSGGGIPAPKWWAKGGKSADRPHAAAHDAPAEVDEAGEEAPAAPSGGTRRSWLAAARRSAEQQPTGADPSPADDSGDAESSKVYITHIYPPGTDDRATHESGHESGDDVGEAPVFTEPPADGPAADRPSWADRRAKVLAERASDPTFDPTADVAPSDLRGRRSRPLAAEAEDVPPTPRPPRVRRSAGPTPSAIRSGEAAVALDRSAGEVRFRLSYGGAIAAGAILLIVILIAYLAGRQRPVAESLVDGPTAGRTVATTPPALAAVSAATAPAAAPAPATVPPATGVPVAPPAPVEPAAPAARQVGMMYVVVQSYPDRETARRAGDFLNRSGVPCTVVPGLSGFALRDWYSVVGLQPFARGDRRPAVQTYLQQLTALGPKFSAKVYNQFQPQLYTWRPDSDAPRP